MYFYGNTDEKTYTHVSYWVYFDFKSLDINATAIVAASWYEIENVYDIYGNAVAKNGDGKYEFSRNTWYRIVTDLTTLDDPVDHLDAAPITDCLMDYADAGDHVYALDGAKVLDATGSGGYIGVNNCHVRMSVNEYGKGRCFYLAGLRYNAMNARLFYRALLWCAGKEELLKKAFSSNVNTECHYYPESKRYALVNNTSEKQSTVFYDIEGNQKNYTLSPNEIVWIDVE